MTVALERVSEVAAGITRVLAPNPGLMTLDGTNTYVCTGASGISVVDPGPLGDGHGERVRAVIAGRDVGAVVLTHMHSDHSEGAFELALELGAPVVRGADQSLTEGSELPGDLTVIGTPGHTGDSVCLLSRGGPVLTGDTILGRGTAVIAHPDGVLGSYLKSLSRLRAYGNRHVLPGHGPTLHDLAGVAELYLAHRERRLDQVLAALADGVPATPAAIVEAVYTDVDVSLWPAAELSVAAQLDYLRQRVAPTRSPQP